MRSSSLYKDLSFVLVSRSTYRRCGSASPSLEVVRSDFRDRRNEDFVPSVALSADSSQRSTRREHRAADERRTTSDAIGAERVIARSASGILVGRLADRTDEFRVDRRFVDIFELLRVGHFT